MTDQHETILGPPGTGKTQTNSNKIRGCIERGIAPDRIACVSFTRKAAKESRERVCGDWGVDERDMPYFQTLHSMAFKAGGYKSDDVIGPKDMREIGDAVGMSFDNKGKADFESDFDTLGAGKGDFYMSQYHLSRSKGQSLEETHRQLSDYNVDWSELKRLVSAYKDYKIARHKIDFTDMIENFIKSDQGPDVDALFVDEAQDLSTLQWSMVDVLRKKPRIQVFTGDDDQAIMGFQGADVNAFLNTTKKKTVLKKSYRLPRLAWEEAQKIVCRIEGRAPKSWSPKDKEGEVYFHQNVLDVPLHEGKWCLMARTNRIASQYAKILREDGWVYSRNGHPSIPIKTYEALHDWEEWCKGEPLTPTKMRNVYTFMNVGEGYVRGFGPRSKGMMGVAPGELIFMADATEKFGLLIDNTVRWHRALGKIDMETRNYVLNALSRKDNVKNPRIKVSTIHSMKGGEEDNILVVPDLSFAAHREYLTNPATEHRAYYVAVTRTKDSLHIMLPQTSRSYPI